VTTAALPIVMSFVTTCVTPSPAHVSFALMFDVCVTVVPFAVPHASVAAVTVMTTEPVFVASAVLVAVIVNVPGFEEMNTAVSPFEITEPPLVLHVTPVSQLELALTVAVRLLGAPVAMAAALAVTETPLTVQVGGVVVVVDALSEPHAD